MGLLFEERLGYYEITSNTPPTTVSYRTSRTVEWAVNKKALYHCMLKALDANIDVDVQERTAMTIKGGVSSPEGSLNRAVLANVLWAVGRHISAKMEPPSP